MAAGETRLGAAAERGAAAPLAFLLPQAEPADVIALVPEGPPQRFPLARRDAWRRPRARAGAHRRRMVAQRREPTRDYYLVEDEAGRRFWLYREGLSARDRRAALVRAWAVRVRNGRHDRYAELAVTTNFSFLRGASHPAGNGGDRRGARPCRHRHCRPQQLCRRRARLSRSGRKRKAVKLLVGTRLVTHRRLRGPRLSDRPHRLWPALPAPDRRAIQSEGKANAISPSRTFSAASDRPDAIAAARRSEPVESGFSPSGWPRSPTPHRDAASSPACIAIAATSRAASACSMSSANARARRSSPSTTCIYHVPERRPLADVLTCIREKCTVAEAGFRLAVERGAASQAARGDGAAVCAAFPMRSRAPSRSPRPAASRSTSSNTNIPTSRCRRARPRSSISRT